MATNGSNGYTTTAPTGSSSGWTSSTALHSPDAISCPSVTFCLAVSNAALWALPISISGTTATWTTNSFGSGTAYTSVWCPSTSFCVHNTGGGVDWSTAPSTTGSTGWTNTAITGNPTVDGVTCAPGSTSTTGLCVLVTSAGKVGYTTNVSGGSWTLATIDGTNVINSVSCSSTTFCAAVDANGNVLTSTNPTGGAGAWTTTSINGTTSINSISCVSTGLCVAGANNGVVLVSSNNGTSWSSPTTIGGGNINSVSCVASGFCATSDVSGDIYYGYPWLTPYITDVTPVSGPIGGANTVNIIGTNFNGVSSTNATSYTVNSATSITATAPSESAATVDITVTGIAGTSPIATSDQYVYNTAGTPSNVSWAVSSNQTSATAAHYKWIFTPATTGTLTSVTFTVPSDTGGTAANVAVYGLGAGTWSGPTSGLITFTITSPASVLSGIPIYMEVSGLTNTATGRTWHSVISTYTSGPTLLDQATANTLTFASSNTATPFDTTETLTFTNDTSAFTLLPYPGGVPISWTVNATVNTNAATGYTLAAKITSLTNGTTTISEMNTAGAASLVLDQFAAQASTTGCATVASPYSSSKYVGYSTSNAAVASCATPTSGADTIAMTNWIQIDSAAPEGTYTATITYVVTPNY